MFDVVIPVYKTRPEHLREAIDSVIAQSCTEWEIYISDGTPEDHEWHSRKVLADYSDKRIHILQQEGKGISNARNQAGKAGTQRFIATLDSDDTWYELKLEYYKQLIAEKPNTKEGTPVAYPVTSQSPVEPVHRENMPKPIHKIIENNAAHDTCPEPGAAEVDRLLAPKDKGAPAACPLPLQCPIEGKPGPLCDKCPPKDQPYVGGALNVVKRIQKRELQSPGQSPTSLHWPPPNTKTRRNL